MEICQHSICLTAAAGFIIGRTKLLQTVLQAPAESPINMPADNRVSPARDKGEWGVDHGSEVAEAGTCYASSDVTDDVGDLVGSLQQDEIKGSFPNFSGPIVPES
ncbi:hypothetical protein V6N13_012990 [Hibiscus sabdariffa]